MEKSYLKSIPLPETDDIDRNTASTLPQGSNVKMLIRTSRFENLLVLTVTARKSVTGDQKPDIVTFIDKENGDFCNRDFTAKGGPKWTDATLTRKYSSSEAMFTHKEEMDLVAQYLGSDKSAYDALDDFYNGILSVRRAERHRKESDAIDLVMNTVKDVPGDFTDWVYTKVLKPHLVFSYVKNENGHNTKDAKVECTACGKKATIRKPKEFKHRAEVKCPFCGAETEVINKSMIRCGWTNKFARIAMLDRTTDGKLVFRYFSAVHKLYLNPVYRDLYVPFEGLRSVMDFSGSEPSYRRYEMLYKYDSCRWWDSPQNGERYSWSTMIPPSGLEKYAESAFLYDENAEQVLTDKWKYFPLKELASCGPGFYEYTLDSFLNYPVFEKLIKVGLANIGTSLSNSYSLEGAIDRNASELLPALHLQNRNQLNLLKKFDTIKVLQIIQKVPDITEEEVKEYLNSNFIYDSHKEAVHEAGVDTRKFYRYLLKHFGISSLADKSVGYYAVNNFIGDYVDYLEDLKFIDVPLTKRNMFPSDVEETHKSIRKQVEAKQKLIELGKLKALNKELAAAAGETEELLLSCGFAKDEKNGFLIPDFNDRYVIIIPKSKTDLSVEGSNLDHCVGGSGYDQKIITKNSAILYIRKKQNPDKSFYTCEFDLKTKTVAQCRTIGDGSCFALLPEPFEIKRAIFKSTTTTTVKKDQFKATSIEDVKKVIGYSGFDTDLKQIANLVVPELVKAQHKDTISSFGDDYTDLRRMHIDADEYVKRSKQLTSECFNEITKTLLHSTKSRRPVRDFTVQFEKLLAKELTRREKADEKKQKKKAIA